MTLGQSKICYELKIFILEEQKDLVSQILTDLEIGDFVYGEFNCDIDAEYNPAHVQLDLYEKHNINSPIIIYNEDVDYLESIQTTLQQLFSKSGINVKKDTFLLKEIDDQNWRESWKESFQPVLISDVFAILPPWEKPENFTQKFKIVIDPGMAFGTGQHETTRLCLEAMLKCNKIDRFFDVGTGSGILAIAAKLLGSKYVLANDIDPECMVIAAENAKNNNINNIIFKTTSVFKMNEENFDVIVANIQSKPLKVLVPDILKRVSLKGKVILSGILVKEKEEFIHFLTENKAKVLESINLNDWCVIVCQA